MKGQSKNPVGVEKGLLNPITMVDVNVNVQHARVMFQQLWERYDNDYSKLCSTENSLEAVFIGVIKRVTDRWAGWLSYISIEFRQFHHLACFLVASYSPEVGRCHA